MSMRRLLTLAVTPLAAGAVVLASAAPASAGAAPRSAAAATAPAAAAVPVPVTGTIGGTPQTGTFTLSNFVRQVGGLLAVGNLNLGGTNLGTVQLPLNPAAPPGRARSCTSTWGRST